MRHRYQTEGQLEDENLDELIHSLDGISQSSILGDMLHGFQYALTKEVDWPLELP